MFLNFATFDSNVPDEELYQNSIDCHFLGGVMTNKYASKNNNLKKL